MRTREKISSGLFGLALLLIALPVQAQHSAEARMRVSVTVIHGVQAISTLSAQPVIMHAQPDGQDLGGLHLVGVNKEEVMVTTDTHLNLTDSEGNRWQVPITVDDRSNEQNRMELTYWAGSGISDQVVSGIYRGTLNTTIEYF